jgi:hypothetical protein
MVPVWWWSCSKVNRSKGPKVKPGSKTKQARRIHARNQNQGPGPKVYIYGMQQPHKKINKKYFRVKVAMGRGRRIFA